MTQPRSEQSIRAERAFYERVAELGGTILEDDWLGANTRHRVRCAAGHETTPLPTSVRAGGGICRTCAGRDSKAADAAFRARVAELGGVVLEPKWLGSGSPHRVRCAYGHENSPHPRTVQQGGGICRTCAGLDPKAAEQAFRRRVSELGGTVLELRWLGSNTPHRIRCSEGHENSPRPSGIAKGRGLCRTCAGIDPRVAERAFRERIEALGGAVLEPKWLGANTPHRVRCKEGHETTPKPANVRWRKGMCRMCAGRDAEMAWQKFQARVEKFGGVVLEPEWLGADTPHRVRCSEGHERAVLPHHLSDRGLCLTCARRDPVRAEEEFRARVQELGGEVLEPVWLGSNEPHRIRCAFGHESRPRPTGVQQGQGICRFCMGKLWDAFYVVVNDAEDMLKFGITSGDPRPRLKRHERDGFERVVRVLTDLPGRTAQELERSVIATLRLAGETPARGVEYFDARVAATVLDIVDHYPVGPVDLTAVRRLVPQQLAFEFDAFAA